MLGSGESWGPVFFLEATPICTVSQVFDHYTDKFKPWQIPWDGTPNPHITPQIPPVLSPPMIMLPLEELRQLIAEFREAIAAAKTVDRLTGQPDCEDPDKAKLEDRVAVLEKKLAALKRRK